MSNLMREEFEFKFPLPSGVTWKESIGMYEVVDVWKLDKPMTIGIYNCRWEGWQASRECLVIELPAKIDVFHDDQYGEFLDAECVKHAIHAAGVKTK